MALLVSCLRSSLPSPKSWASCARFSKNLIPCAFMVHSFSNAFCGTGGRNQNSSFPLLQSHWWILPSSPCPDCDNHLHYDHIDATYFCEPFCLSLRYSIRRDGTHRPLHYPWALSPASFFQVRQGVSLNFPGWQWIYDPPASPTLLVGLRGPRGFAYCCTFFHFPDFHLSANARMGMLKKLFPFYMFISLFLTLSYLPLWLCARCVYGR